jgi:tetratricopeptide (TPR) repeat protein
MEGMQYSKDIRHRYSPLAAALTCAFVLLLVGCSPSATPPEAIKQYMQGEDFYVRGQVEAALAVFERLSRQFPRFLQARFMEAKSLYLLNRPREAETALRELVRLEPRYNEAQIWLARIMVQQGETAEAERLVSGLLSLDSQDARLLYLMAHIRTDQGKLQDALVFLEKAGDTEEELARVHLELGSLYHRFGLEDKARVELSRVLVLLPESSPLRKPVTDLLGSTGKRSSRK